MAGEVYSVQVKKKYDSVETLELSKNTNLEGKKIIIIDDGIASGNTINGIYELGMQAKANNIKYLIVAIRHHYTECNYNKTPIYWN